MKWIMILFLKLKSCIDVATLKFNVIFLYTLFLMTIVTIIILFIVDLERCPVHRGEARP